MEGTLDTTENFQPIASFENRGATAKMAEEKELTSNGSEEVMERDSSCGVEEKGLTSNGTEEVKEQYSSCGAEEKGLSSNGTEEVMERDSSCGPEEKVLTSNGTEVKERDSSCGAEENGLTSNGTEDVKERDSSCGAEGKGLTSNGAEEVNERDSSCGAEEKALTSNETEEMKERDSSCGAEEKALTSNGTEEVKELCWSCGHRLPASCEPAIVRRPYFLVAGCSDHFGSTTIDCTRLSPTDEKAIKLEYKLFWAAFDGRNKEIGELLALGASVDADKYNSSPIHKKGGHITPLQVAAAASHADCVRRLLSHGANPNEADYLGITPLMYAAMKGDLCSLKILLSAGAQCNSATKLKFYHSLIDNMIPTSTTALHFAAANNHIKCVRELIQSGADCGAQDGKGRTSLYLATKFGFRDCVLVHIDSASNHDFLSLCTLDKRNTPLYCAVDLWIEDCVQALVRRGADVSLINSKGYSPLLFSLVYAGESASCARILRIILMEGHNLDVGQIDFSEYPGMHYVCAMNTEEGILEQTHGRCGSHEHRRSEVVKLLLASGVNAHVRMPNSCTLLEHELNSPDEELELLKRVVDVLPSTRIYNKSLNIPQEFTVDPRRRKIFTRALLANRRRLSLSSIETSHGRIHEMYLTSDDLSPAKGLRIFWPPQGIITQTEAETYIAFHLSNRLRVSYLSYEEFTSELRALWRRWCVYLKHKWYYDTMKNPRSLKDICRYAVRNALSDGKLPRNTKKLDIPISLRSYLLYFEDTH